MGGVRREDSRGELRFPGGLVVVEKIADFQKVESRWCMQQDSSTGRGSTGATSSSRGRNISLKSDVFVKGSSSFTIQPVFFPIFPSHWYQLLNKANTIHCTINLGAGNNYNSSLFAINTT